MNAELIEYYVNLLILQYRNKPRARAFIAAIIRVIMIFDILDAIENGYDIDTAIGAQQDILGKILGIDRVITGTAFDRTYFGFIRYGDNPATSIYGGFARYGVPQDAQFLRYGEIQQSRFSLNDVEFRDALLFKAAQNVSNHSVADIDNLLFDIYGGAVTMEDNFDMSMTYNFPLQNQRLALIFRAERLLLKPAGVDINLTFT